MKTSEAVQNIFSVVLNPQIKMSFNAIVQKAAKCIKVSQKVGTEDNPRFIAFTAPSSICSEKVRAVLGFKRVSYLNHSVDLMTTENYHPDYCQMRALGYTGNDLVGTTEWTGSTSTATFGFDPLVVPTLVDTKERRVIVDSAKIIKYIDYELPEPALFNDTHLTLIEKHVTLVDDTPHAGLLYGGDPDKDFLPEVLKAALFGSPSIHDLQEQSLAKWLDNKDLPSSLRHFYEAKLRKCINVGQVVQKDPDRLRQGIAKTKRILLVLDTDLEHSKGPWICDDTFTMADLVWHVSLLRFLTFGCSYLTEAMPRVEAYRDRLLSHPLLKAATYTWPGFIPSPHLTALLKKEGSFVLAERNRALVVLLGLGGGLLLGIKELIKYLFDGWHGGVSLGIFILIFTYTFEL